MVVLTKLIVTLLKLLPLFQPLEVSLPVSVGLLCVVGEERGWEVGGSEGPVDSTGLSTRKAVKQLTKI